MAGLLGKIKIGFVENRTHKTTDDSKPRLQMRTSRILLAAETFGKGPTTVPGRNPTTVDGQSARGFDKFFTLSIFRAR
jgi:hypothetical protein